LSLNIRSGKPKLALSTKIRLTAEEIPSELGDKVKNLAVQNLKVKKFQLETPNVDVDTTDTLTAEVGKMTAIDLRKLIKEVLKESQEEEVPPPVEETTNFPQSPN